MNAGLYNYISQDRSTWDMPAGEAAVEPCENV